MKRIFLLVMPLCFGGLSFSQNLLQNGTFDSAGVACGSHWFDYCGNEITYAPTSGLMPCFVNLVNDAPPAALPSDTTCVFAHVGPPGHWGVRSFVTGITGTFVYELKYWMKSGPDVNGNTSYGYSAMGTWTNGFYTPVKIFYASNPNWVQYTISDTISTAATDSIYVDLYAPGPDFFQQRDYFDLVELAIIDTITVNGIARGSKICPKIYPVPSGDRVSIELPKGNYDQLEVIIYNSVGQSIKQQKVTNEIINLHIDNFGTGVYFFRIVDKTGALPGLSGKFIFD